MTKSISERVAEMLLLPPRELYYEMRRIWVLRQFLTISLVGKALARKRSPFGGWQQAKTILDSMSEPRIDMQEGNRKHLDTYLPDILGYHCHYVKNLTKGGKKSWVAIINGETGSVYTKDFSELTAETVSEIFNS